MAQIVVRPEAIEVKERFVDGWRKAFLATWWKISLVFLLLLGLSLLNPRAYVWTHHAYYIILICVGISVVGGVVTALFASLFYKKGE